MLYIFQNPRFTQFLNIRRHEVTLWMAFLVSLPVLTLWVLIFVVGEQRIRNNFSRPVAFRVRLLAGTAPTISPDLKVLRFDQQTKNYLRSNSVSLRNWADILRALAVRQPNAVIIHSAFQTPGNKTDTAYFNRVLKNLKFPVITGIRVLDKADRNWHPLPRQPYYSPEFWGVRGEPVFKDVSSKWMYGPLASLRASLPLSGHFEFENGSTFAFLRRQDGTLVPAAALLLGKDQHRYHRGKMHMVGQSFQIGQEGRIQVNLVAKDEILLNSEPLANILRISERELGQVMPASQTYLILPGERGEVTAATPLGEYKESYLLTSLVNSLVQGGWVRNLPFSVLWVILLGVVGIMVNWAFKPRYIMASLVVGPILISLLGLYAFISFGIDAPWFCCASAFVLSGSAVFSEKKRLWSLRKDKLQEALRGMVPQETVDRVLKNPKNLDLKPSEHHITVLFVDVAGFSLVAEKMSPKNAFDHLKAILTDLTRIVHQHGGTVDKNLGDGLLCFFGYRFGLGESVLHHPDQAIRCAIAMQKLSMETVIVSQAKGMPVFPIRIGVNTARAYIGDVGSGAKIELTLIGDGVNFARRLETACDEFGIMIGSSTVNAISNNLSRELNLRRRLIQVKHHQEFMEAYDWAAYRNFSELHAKADHAARASRGVSRQHQRWHSDDENPIVISTSDHGSGVLMDFSEGGMGVVFEKYLARGVQIAIELDEKSGKLNRQLHQKKLLPITCEVRWAREDRETAKFRMGLSFLGVSRTHTRQLCDVLIRFLEESNKKAV